MRYVGQGAVGEIDGALATVVTLPFRALARLFGGASRSARGRRA